MNIRELTEQWISILERIKMTDGEIIELIADAPATEQEILSVEAKLGIQLPKDFKQVLMEWSKHLYFRWMLSDEVILPDEFREIFSGEVGWNLEWLQYWGEDIAKEEYASSLAGKLTFFHVGNGDYLALDVQHDSEAPVVYWDHETDEATLLAASFSDYVNKMTELGCIGAEMWQYECFIGSNGIETNTDIAHRWRAWFQTFLSLRFEDARGSLDSIIPYILYHGAVNSREVSALQSFRHDEILHHVQKRLSTCTPKETKALCMIVGEAVKEDAEEWVRELWTEPGTIDPVDRSYLTARCLPHDEAYQLLVNFVEEASGKEIEGYEALRHLSALESNRVITWLEKNCRLPATNGWAALFAISKPSWDDLHHWAELEPRHRLTIIHGLDEMIREQNTYNSTQGKVYGVPSKDEMLGFLGRLHDEEILNTKKAIIRKIADQVDKILQ
ncbi:SMI1/KNR4 family protein [Brevibacillus reuszeri]|uniref:SMI1/KNR4 family protein n=1 Tax=Brevibacillus reuszeri TaxID=54915 RepID=UPI0028972914|nr:SMI1/KNR4 family protein [Brevibacillus reuszeri]